MTYLVVDTQAMRFIAHVETYREAEILQHPAGAKGRLILEAGQRRGYTKFNETDLRRLCESAGKHPPAGADYAELIQGAQAIGAAIPLETSIILPARRKSWETSPNYQDEAAAPAVVSGTMAVADRPRQTTGVDDMAAKKTAAPAAPAPPAVGVPAAPKAPKAPKAPAVPKAPKAAKPAAPKAPAAPAVPKPPKDIQNGQLRPRAGTSGDKIWTAADKISKKKEAPAEYAEVAKALDGAGIPDASVRAGFQHWRKYNGLTKAQA